MGAARTLLLCCALCACSSQPGAASHVPADASDLDGSFANPSGLLPMPDAAPTSTMPDSGPCLTTFQAITRTIFDGAGCTGGACHTTPGPDTPAAGLDLTRDDAYRDLVGVPARTPLQPTLMRIAKGDELSSFLYLKVAAAEPGGAPLPSGGGAPMPVGLPPLASSKLALLRLWIRAGAPETGVVDGTQAQVDGCQSASP
jgi:hypothetical protein